MVRAFITGLEGLGLKPAEREFLRESAPWGLILFRRNIDTPEQVRRLVAAFRDAVGNADAPVLIDQEGGRVQRLGPPHWPVYPPGSAYAALFEADPARGLAAARLGARLIANDLAALGITINCLPLADVPVPGADGIIGDRAYGSSPSQVAALGQAVAEGLADGGVLPVLKHLPGHGRANADSHERLPVVGSERATLEATDFAAFKPLASLPLGMTAHVVYTAIDPVAPATTSSTVISNVIRGFIGFKGLLMSDDISMGAMSGTIADRTRAALAAGCDLILHCNGRLHEMREAAAHTPSLTGEAAQRAQSALASRKSPVEIDIAEARAQFSDMMQRVRFAGQVTTA